MIRTNLHTHTSRCRHASGAPADYVAAASVAGMAVLGFSDHVPLPGGFSADWRMGIDELDAHVAEVRAAAAGAPAGLRVLLGMECDDPYGDRSWYADELLGRRGFTYLMAAVHDVPVDGAWISGFTGLRTPQALRIYADAVVSAIASGLYAAIAHPDACGSAGLAWTPDHVAMARDIGAASASHGVPLEINTYGLRKPWVGEGAARRAGYPWRPFWEAIAGTGARVVLGSDAHRPQDVTAGLDDIAALASELGLVVDDLAGRLVAAA